MRVNWVDNTKAIAIFLVVLGHFSGLDFNVKNFVYSFHLPVFLLVSGFLIKNKLNKLTATKFLSNEIKDLLKLYFVFSIFSILIFIIIELAKGQTIDYIGLIQGTLYGIHGVESLLMHGNGALWYFPFFISSVFIFYFVLKLPKSIGWVIGIVFALFSSTYHGIRLPWAIDLAGIGVLFLLIGGELKFYYEKVKSMFSSKLSLYITPLLITVLFYLTIINGKTNINRAVFGENVFLYFINALIGCWLVLVISHHLKKSRLAELFSTHTLIIFSIHLYLVKSLRIVTSISNELLRILVIMLLSFLITYACMQASRLIMPLLSKHILNKGK